MKSRKLLSIAGFAAMMIVTASLTSCATGTPSAATAIPIPATDLPPVPTEEPAVEPTRAPPASVTVAETGHTLTLLWQSEFSADAALSAPNDVAVDSDGNSYVSVQSALKIKKFDSQGKLIAQWGESGTGDGQIGLSAGIAVDTQNNVYIADFAAMRILKFTSTGEFLLQWPTEPPDGPASVAVDHNGYAYVDNFFAHEHHVEKFDSTGKRVKAWGESGPGNGQIGDQPEDIAVDKEGNVYVADRLNHLIQKFDPDGNFLAQFGGERSPDGKGLFTEPRGIAIDAQGNMYVVDEYFLQKLGPDGGFIAQWPTAKGSDLDRAGLLAVDEQGDLYILAYGEITSVTGDTVSVVLLKKFSQS